MIAICNVVEIRVDARPCRSAAASPARCGRGTHEVLPIGVAACFSTHVSA